LLFARGPFGTLCLTNAQECPAAPRLVRAWLDSLSSGIVEFDRNWDVAAPPAIALSGSVGGHPVCEGPGPGGRQELPLLPEGSGDPRFALPLQAQRGSSGAPTRRCTLRAPSTAGRLRSATRTGGCSWRPGRRGRAPVDGPARKVLKGNGEVLFKFVTGENQWLHPSDDAPNCVRDETGFVNRFLPDKDRGPPLALRARERPLTWRVLGRWHGRGGRLDRTPPLPLSRATFSSTSGTTCRWAPSSGNSTTFRLLPRGPSPSRVCLPRPGDPQGRGLVPARAPRGRRHGAGGVWEVELDRNLHGWFYWYSIEADLGRDGKVHEAGPHPGPLCPRGRRPPRAGHRPRPAAGSGRATRTSGPRPGRTS
jgi:pullulanase